MKVIKLAGNIRSSNGAWGSLQFGLESDIVQQALQHSCVPPNLLCNKKSSMLMNNYPQKQVYDIFNNEF